MTELVVSWAGGVVRESSPARLGHPDFPAFYESHYGEVAGYVWTLVRDREHAEDLTQEAFTRLLARWRGVDEPRPYLFQIATNLARTSWKRSGRHRVAVALLGHGPDAPAADEGLGVREAVSRLPERLRDAVLLFYFADLTIADVAQALGRPEGTVKRLLNEARAALATSLTGVES